MGNSNSASLDFEYNITASDYTPLRKFHDFLLGEFFEVKHTKTGDILLLKVRATNDLYKYQQIIENSYHRLSLSHKNLAKIHGFAGRETKSGRTCTYKLYIYFQPLPIDLAKAMKSRRTIFSSGQQRGNDGKTTYLQETQLYNIMMQMVEVLEYLQINGINHGDIRPEACFIRDNGILTICDRRLIYDGEWDSSTEIGHEKNFLLSPAGLDAYAKLQRFSQENKHKADVFSAGMTLLECATYKRSSQLYEWKSLPFINREALSTRLAEVQRRYSPRLYQILSEMLKFEEHLRPDFIRLKKWLMGTEPIGVMSFYNTNLKVC